ncbi:hypothetical protein IQ259_12270 [Fortiea sp. LEGE XX443]|uniref:hypothetical protein n=1 Tax=Fortiea sp. LEGE XX443 TaxID=1828611 RepID=UPI001880FC8D|nr:hypothetical protein [Fortiea sp. LEGE XX443]MBE9005802.1 hypothetical protein [Fortiea sp. LEGE XX443]
MTITLVKKLKLDGQVCAKSARVLANLEERGLLSQIHQVITADERDTSSQGYALAAQYHVDAAPFFIVTGDDGKTQVYLAYHHFLKDIFNQEVTEADEVAEIMSQNPDLDFI